jgi:hypothetical protein
MFQPDQALRSLILVSWRRADYYVHELVSGLRLGLTGCRPFLKRSECARLRRQLVRLETLTRRVLVLFVLECPLPRVTVRAGQAVPGRPPSRTASAPRRFFTPPTFRLADPRPRTTSVPPPRRTPRTLRPRLLYLDQPLPPPEPGEFPPHPDDLVPATPLIRRARALKALFDDPAPHIARMARRLARARLSPTRPLPLAGRLPPAARTRRQDATERDAALSIHRAACLALARLDTS